METFAETFSAVVLANFVTAWFAYAMWRLKRDEKDLKAMGIALACLGFVGLHWLLLPV